MLFLFTNLQLQANDSMLEQAMKDMEKMRRITRSLVENSSTSDSEKCVASVKLENDQGYFNTYSHFGIHHEMLSVYYFARCIDFTR